MLPASDIWGNSQFTNELHSLALVHLLKLESRHLTNSGSQLLPGHLEEEAGSTRPWNENHRARVLCCIHPLPPLPLSHSIFFGAIGFVLLALEMV